MTFPTTNPEYTPHTTDRECETMLGKIRVKRGMTIKKLSALSGVPSQKVYDLTWGREAPIYTIGPQNGEVKPSVKRICAILKADPSEVFPLYICGVDFRPNDEKLTTELLTGEGSYLMSRDPAELLEADDWCWKSCKELNRRERFALVSIDVCDATLDELGDILSVSRERARQLHKTGMRKAVVGSARETKLCQ